MAMLSSGLPMFSPNDVNRDDRVTLKDLILSVRDFSYTAERPASFTSNIKRVLSTLHVVAGFKTDIRPAKDKQSSTSVSSLNISYLIPSNTVFNLSDNTWELIEKPFSYKSIFTLSDTPPPQYSPAC